jgi:hypothetical protein
MKKRLSALLSVLALGLALVAVGATPASSATPQVATPNWWTCSSYDKVCLGTDVAMDPLGRQLNVYSVGVGCINLTSDFNDAITSIDNAWNDADIRFRFYWNSNCTGNSGYIDGNDAVSLNCCQQFWGFNDNISSFKIECVDFFGNCYYGP